jgi:tetratricopeptide (TPR) repeat protein
MSRTPRGNSANKKRTDKLFPILIVAFIALIVYSWQGMNATMLLLLGVMLMVCAVTYISVQHPLVYYSFIIKLFPWWAPAYHKRGNAYWWCNEHQCALTDYDQAIQRQPGYADTYVDRGLVYYDLGEHQHCLRDCEQAIVLNNRLARAYIGLGLVHDSLQEYQQAIEDYTRAAELYAIDPWLFGNRGVAYYKLKDYRRAIQDCNRALALDSGYIWAYCYRSLAYNRLGEYELALHDGTHAIKLDSTLAYAYACRGQAYLRLSDLQQALVDFSKAWELDSTRVYYGWLIEWSKMCLPHPDTARAERLEALAARDPSHHLAFVCRAVAHWLQENFEAAWRELQQAPPPEPNDEAFSFWRGMIYVSLERDDEALAALEQALPLPPVLLTPLRWIEHQRPDFYRKEVVPLLAR